MKFTPDMYNPDIDWSHAAELLREVEGSALVARMNARALASGSSPDTPRTRAIFTQALLTVVLRSEFSLNYVFPDPELDRETESALRLLITGVAEPDDPDLEEPPRFTDPDNREEPDPDQSPAVRVPERPE